MYWPDVRWSMPGREACRKCHQSLARHVSTMTKCGGRCFHVRLFTSSRKCPAAPRGAAEQRQTIGINVTFGTFVWCAFPCAYAVAFRGLPACLEHPTGGTSEGSPCFHGGLAPPLPGQHFDGLVRLSSGNSIHVDCQPQCHNTMQLELVEDYVQANRYFSPLHQQQK